MIRDDAGSVVCADAAQCEHLLDAMHAEALGCLEGIRAAVARGISKVVIETDSTLLKLAVDSNN